MGGPTVTSQLFAERFLTSLREGPPRDLPRYDDQLGYSVDIEGRPYVASRAIGETRTASEVVAERDDFDDDRGTRTATFVEAEAEDYEAAASLRTETAIKAERPDYDTWASTTTFTKVEAEAEDRD